jgi:hypothetical protein
LVQPTVSTSTDNADLLADIFLSVLRIVDARAILYLTCPDPAKALELVNLINQQSRQANHGVV